MMCITIFADDDDDVYYYCITARDDDDDVYYYIRWRLKLEGETENMGVCTCVNLRLQSALGDHWCYHQVGQASGRTPQADLC